MHVLLLDTGDRSAGSTALAGLFRRRKAAAPPLDLLLVAALLPDDWTVKLVDMDVDKLRKKDIARVDLILVEGDTGCLASLAKLLRRFSSCRIVAVGALAGAVSGRVPEIDHYIVNDYATTVPAFVYDLLAGRAEREYRSPDGNECSSLPTPRWSLLRLKSYGAMVVRYANPLPRLASTLRRVRAGRKGAVDERIVRELESLRAAGWRGTVRIQCDGLSQKRRDAVLETLGHWQEATGRPFVFDLPAKTRVSSAAVGARPRRTVKSCS